MSGDATSINHNVRIAGSADIDPPTVTHRKYVPYSDAHYGGALLDGSYSLKMFGDLATELCIYMDRDEALFASYQDVQFRAPIYGGDIIEARATLIDRGARSRLLEFGCVVLARSAGSENPSASQPLDPPITAVVARGTVVVTKLSMTEGEER